MKRLSVLVLAFVFGFSSMSFGTALPSPATTASADSTITLKDVKPTPVDNYFPQQMFQTSKSFGPVLYEFTKEQFATPRWSQLTQSAYVQQTDISFILTQILVTGAVVQKTILSSEDLNKELAAIEALNTEIKAEATAKPDATFSKNYEDVFKGDLQLLYEASPVDYGKLSPLGIESKYPDLVNKVSMSIKVFKKGSLYLIENWQYPSLNWSTKTAATLTEAEKQLNELVSDNNEALVTLGLAKPMPKPKTPVVIKNPNVVVKPPVKPVPPKTPATSKVIYVLVKYPNGTAEIKTFNTQKEATTFVNQATKKYGKDKVQQFTDKKSADAALKQATKKKGK